MAAPSEPWSITDSSTDAPGTGAPEADATTGAGAGHVLVWHRRDLRTADNAALRAAAAAAEVVTPVFVLDPAFYDERSLACDARVEFCFDCLADLREQYRDLGTDLVLLAGDPVERLRALLDAGDADAVYLNREVTVGRARERDRTVLGWSGTRAFADDGIVRTDADRTFRRSEPPADGDGDAGDESGPDARDGWAEQCEAHLEAAPHPRPEGLTATPVASTLTLDDARERWDVAPAKERVPRGGTTAARARLDRFVETIREYPRSVAQPARAERYCSRLSPYLKFGALSLRQVYRRLHERAPDCHGRETYVSRLFWNRHYTQKLADWPGARYRTVNPVFRNLHRETSDPALVAAWKEGRTGFPLVDAAMRALVETGWINFRARAMCVSVFSYLLGGWWREGAEFFYYHLIDADPAINFQQWQSQSGLVGAHPIRVYDPAKQAREYDPDGEYVRRYVPELAPLPDEHLPRPEKTPPSVQAEVGVRVGEDYPSPVVDYEREARRAREEMARLHDRAEEALFSDPELLRRASLSRRREREDGERRRGGGDGGQATLEEF
jgi:deoxyribodipyrimidine photo-lyase